MRGISPEEEEEEEEEGDEHVGVRTEGIEGRNLGKGKEERLRARPPVSGSWSVTRVPISIHQQIDRSTTQPPISPYEQRTCPPLVHDS